MKLGLQKLSPLGAALRRPECVLACADGFIYASDKQYGVARVSQNGEVAYAAGTPKLKSEFVPNGIALTLDGEFLISNIGDDGGLWLLGKDGVIQPFCLEISGESMPPVNFVMIDQEGHIWLSVSTRKKPRHLAYRNDVADGFIAKIENGRCEIIVDGLAYTNEIRIDSTGTWLYVSETFGHRILRYRLQENGKLSQPEIFGTVERDDFVDGIAFDEEGGVWAICIVSNRVYRFNGDGSRETIFAETPVQFTGRVLRALENQLMGREHFDTTPNLHLKNVTSLAFSGPNRTKAVLGNLCGDALVSFDVEIAGVEPVHWNVTPSVGFFQNSEKE